MASTSAPKAAIMATAANEMIDDACFTLMAAGRRGLDDRGLTYFGNRNVSATRKPSPLAAPDDSARGRFRRREKEALRDVTKAKLYSRRSGDVVLPGTGSMVREITFQSSLISMGMTGWIFTVALSPSSGP